MKTYFVTYRLYNGENGGWAFKEEKVDEFAVAIQKYGALINQYYGKTPFVFGYIAVEDERGSRYQMIEWGAVPSPSAEEEVAEA